MQKDFDSQSFREKKDFNSPLCLLIIRKELLNQLFLGFIQKKG